MILIKQQASIYEAEISFETFSASLNKTRELFVGVIYKSVSKVPLQGIFFADFIKNELLS